MSDNVIDIINLSKRYRLGTISRGMLSRDISSAWSRFRGKDDPNSRVTTTNDLHSLNDAEMIWALKDINLQVQHGEILGIIGKNGAGKSTLLKILSRITSPTKGEIRIKGRVASLLEVGTGFHSELTGRENIFLNGAILGMTKTEIDKKFDEIIDFSGIEKYIDTPVKRYSSGMRVRLGFSVAAHLDPEILLVDEVLAVGDAEFRRKSQKKMESDSTKLGKTIILVSHQLRMIEQLCTKLLLMEKGEVVTVGTDVNKIISDYRLESLMSVSQEWINDGSEYNNEYFKAERLRLVSNENITINKTINNVDDIWIEIQGTVEEIDKTLKVGIALNDENQNILFESYINNPLDSKHIKKGLNIFRAKLPLSMLKEGKYEIQLISGLHNIRWFNNTGNTSPNIVFEITDSLMKSSNLIEQRGLLNPNIKWSNHSE